MRNDRKRKKWQIIVGILLIVVGTAALVLYLSLRGGRFEGKNGKVQISSVTHADLFEDASKIAINDNDEKVYCLDVKTGNVIYILDFHEVEHNEHFEIEDVAFDQNENLYVHLVEFNSTDKYIVKESFCVFDSAGKLLHKIIWNSYEETDEVTRERILSYQIVPGGIRCLTAAQNVITLEDFVVDREEHTTIAQFRGSEYQRVRVGNINDDGTFSITWNNGELGEMNVQGYRTVAKLDYDITYYKDNNILPGMATKVNGEYYVLDNSLFSRVYVLRDHTWKKFFDTKKQNDLSDMSQNDVLEFYVDNLIYAIKGSNDRLLVCVSDQVYLVHNNGITNIITDSHKVPLRYALAMTYRKVALPLIVILFAAGTILVVGYAMRWHLTLLSQIIASVVVVVLGIGIASVKTITGQVERSYYQKVYEEYAAYSQLALLQIDPHLIEQMHDLSCVDEGIEAKLQTQLEEICDNLNYEWNDELILGIYSYRNNGINRILAGTDNDMGVFSDYYLLTMEKLEKNRLGTSHTYITTSYTSRDGYITAITEIRNEQGEVVGFLDMSAEQEQLQEVIKSLRMTIVLRFIALIFILLAILVFFAKYVYRNLDRTSKVIAEISKGNLNVRVPKIPRDSLGVIAQGVNDMADQIKNMFAEKDKLTVNMVETLVTAIDAKDIYTNGHSVRVAKYAREIARRAGKSEKYQLDIYYSGLLHDIGKIGIPDTIINKTTSLTDEEFEIIKTHPGIGEKILCQMPVLVQYSVGAVAHHERYDGTGYPKQLKGKEIPDMARIIGVADAYDAMTSNRSYRNALSKGQVIVELEKGKGTQFDEEYVQIMIDIIKE